MSETTKLQQNLDATVSRMPESEVYSGELTSKELDECACRWSTTGPTPWSFGQGVRAICLRNDIMAEAIDRVEKRVRENKPVAEVFYPDNTKKDPKEIIAEFVETTILSRDARHRLKGYQNHNNRLGNPVNPERAPYLGDAELKLIERKAELGVATPLELLKLRNDIGMGSIELGRAIGDDELLVQLENEVSQAVEVLGGVIVSENDKQTRVKVRALNGVEGNGGSDILTITKREVFAKCGGTYVMRRSSYLVPRKMIDRQLREVTGLSKIPSEGDEQKWLQDFNRRNSKTLAMLRDWLDQKTVGVSTTLYAVDKEAIDAINRKSTAAKLGARAIGFSS